MKKYTPLFIFLLGIFLLSINPELAFACFIICIVVIIERIWPEKWGTDEIS